MIFLHVETTLEEELEAAGQRGTIKISFGSSYSIRPIGAIPVWVSPANSSTWTTTSCYVLWIRGSIIPFLQLYALQNTAAHPKPAWERLSSPNSSSNANPIVLMSVLDRPWARGFVQLRSHGPSSLHMNGHLLDDVKIALRLSTRVLPHLLLWARPRHLTHGCMCSGLSVSQCYLAAP